MPNDIKVGGSSLPCKIFKRFGRSLRGPRALDSPVQIRKPVSKKFIAWLKFQFLYSPFLKTVTETKNHCWYTSLAQLIRFQPG